MAADRILEGLNEAQRRAVTHDTGPLLIVAGAGTGKTTVITRRIAWLIATRRARPDEILALTFTDKAAAEMEERVDTLVPYGYADVEIATFHAFGDRILREHALEIGLTPDFRVLNRAEQTIFFRDRLFELPLAHYRPLGDPTRHLQALITLISRCKDEDISPEEYQAHAGRLEREAAAAVDYEEARERAAQQRELAATYAKYEELMTRDGCVDFGDQIVQVLRLFRRRPYVLGAYQRRFRYILVDEFQDTNHAQFELVKLLAARHSNVAVVGGEDQAIYRFRGAAISNILGFLDVYHDAAHRELPFDAGDPRRRVSLDRAQQSGSARGQERHQQAADGGGRAWPAAGALALRDGDPGGRRRCRDDPREDHGRHLEAGRRRHPRARERRC